MNDVSVNSELEMSYWKAWFHFWVKSFFIGVYDRDKFNPSFYSTNFKRRLRLFISFCFFDNSFPFYWFIVSTYYFTKYF